MKSLQNYIYEGIFGDNITNNPNVTDLNTAVSLLINSLEKELKMNCIHLDGKKEDDVKSIWKSNNFALTASRKSSNCYCIYLQYNRTEPSGVKEGEEAECMDISFRLYIEIVDYKAVRLDEVGIDLFRDFSYVYGSCTQGYDIKEKGTLKDVYFNNNTTEILNYIVDRFKRFKNSVSSDKTTYDKVCKNVYDGFIGGSTKYFKHIKRVEDGINKIYFDVVRK